MIEAVGTWQVPHAGRGERARAAKNVNGLLLGRSIGLLALGALLVPTGCGGGGGGGGPPAGEPVLVQRDPSGVAHVFASTDAGALYGLGWATARDRLFQMTQSRLAAQGRIAEFFGAGLANAYVTHDRAARLQGWYRHAVKVASLLDSETLDLLQAYSDGVNAFMNKKNKTIHAAFSSLALPLDPWTPEDCIAVWLRFGRHFGGDGSEEVARLRQWETLLATMTFNEAYNEMLGDVVCDEPAAVVQEAEVPLAVRQSMQAYATQNGLAGSGICPTPLPSPKFSQAWAVAGARTTTGKALLVSEPRGEVFKPNKFYEWSLEGETLSVRGIGVAGSPIVLAGSTPAVAWGPTALGLDQADLFSITADPAGHPGQYLIDGLWVDYAVEELETIHVRGAADVFATYRETVWGPIVTPILPGVLPGEVFAVHRTPFVDPKRDAARGFFRMARAADVDEFLDAVADWNWPSINVVCADAGGRIAYTIAGDVPVHRPNLTLPGMLPQDGSTLASSWIGRLPWGLQPHVIDPPGGALFSANHMPVGAWYPIPLRLGTGAAGDTFRSRRLRERLTGLPALATPDEVEAPRLDLVNPARRDLATLGLWLRDQQSSHALSPEALAALGELEPWLLAGATMDDTHRGVAVAWFMDLLFRESETGPELIDFFGGGTSGLNLFLKTALAGIQAVPAVPLSPEAAAYVDRILVGAWDNTAPLGDPTGWLGWYRANVLTFDVVPFKTLEGFQGPGIPLSVGPVLGGDPQTLHAPIEQGYTQVVSPGSAELARTLLPPGLSELTGKLEQNLVSLWEHGDLKDAPLTGAELQAAGGGSKSTVYYDPGP